MNNTFGPSLKFRAADKDTGRVFTYTEFTNPMFDSIEFTAAGSRFYQPAINGAILSHFTGIFDINKQEIYSGDVLHDLDNENHPFRLVYWDENDARYRADPLLDWNTGEVQRMMFSEHESDFATDALYMPVVANIWEKWVDVQERMKS